MQLTILMPCLNEERSISYCIQKSKLFLDKSGLSSEILIVDNGSSDSSANFARALGVRVVHENSRGYGSAIQRGIKEARGKYIILGDCDGSYDFENLGVILSELMLGYDFVCGNRFKGGIDKGAMPFLHKLGSPILSLIARLKYDVPIKDFHCGLRGFRSDFAKQYSYKTTGMDFATELIYSFRHKNIKEVPVKLHKDLRNRRPHLRTFQDGLRHLHFIITNK